MTEFEFKFLNLLKEQGKKKQDVSRLLGVTQPTLKARLSNPDSFKIGEAKKVNQFLKTNIISL